jgi:4-hydroxy-tetrahydrodipicolinate synthase
MAGTWTRGTSGFCFRCLRNQVGEVQMKADTRKSVIRFVPEGVIPACLMPFREDLEIDEIAYREHLADLASIQGISGITINGHAAEVHALSFEEQIRAARIAFEAVGDRTPIIAGVFTDSTAQAAKISARVTEEGASALLVFPPGPLGLGGQMRAEMAHAHLKAITDATDLPLIIFQYPAHSELAYPLETLVSLSERYDSICAIKDWSGDPVKHERTIRQLHHLNRPVNVLTTHSMWLLPSLVLGARGILSGAGSVVAELHLALWQAVQDDALGRAREIYDRVQLTVSAFYADPLVDIHNRMKEALVLLGRAKTAYVRPPLVKLPAEEIDRIAVLLRQAGLFRDS